MLALDTMRNDVTMTSYVLFAGKEPAGILVTSTPDVIEHEGDVGSYLEDIYVIYKYRGNEIASDIFTRFIKQQKHPTCFCVMKKNAHALALLEENMQKNGFYYERKEYDQGRWCYKVAMAK